MRAVKIAAAVMAVMIVLGTTVLVIAVIQRLSAPALPAMAVATAMTMDEPSGTSIAAIVAVGDRLAVQLRGGGPDRVVFVDPRTGAIGGRISLAK